MPRLIGVGGGAVRGCLVIADTTEKIGRSLQYGGTRGIPRINPAVRGGGKTLGTSNLLNHAFPFASNEKQLNSLFDERDSVKKRSHLFDHGVPLRQGFNGAHSC